MENILIDYIFGVVQQAYNTMMSIKFGTIPLLAIIVSLALMGGIFAFVFTRRR